MDDFSIFASAVRRKFEEMAEDTLFEVPAEGLWEAYLGAFPAGSNPLFRKRTTYDCSCCRHFIRAIGNVVAIQNGALTSVWDLNGLPSPFQEVADTMAVLVRERSIEDVFLSKVVRVGTAQNPDTALAIQWSHFYCDVPRTHISADPTEKRGHYRTNQQVLLRAMNELKPEAIDTVRDLIRAGALYRGEEHLAIVEDFGILQMEFLGCADRNLKAWKHCGDTRMARFRNSVIGTLVQDLSAEVELEDAVRLFEAKVAPQNYRRSSALITPRMVTDALKTLEAEGLSEAVYRRHARFGDVSVNSVLFVDNSVRGKMKDGLEALLMPEAKKEEKKIAGQEISMEDFIKDVLPRTTALDLFVEHPQNFMSLTAPQHADVGQLFRWPNNFAWSYDGNVTDSIKERVKRAGGQVEGVALRVSLAWSNYDDLDLHCLTPQAQHIYYSQRYGVLDVDMNAGGGTTRQPVENMRWLQLQDGQYKFTVHNFRRREAIDTGFTIEIEHDGGLSTLSYPKPLENYKEVGVCFINVSGGRVTSIIPSKDLVVGNLSQEKWGIRTQSYVRVNSVLLSPNHWSEPVGNKHHFFILEGMKCPDPVRGFYNEYLHPRLDKHRKVFEILADKTKCPPADEQLSGVGFSSTVRNKVSVIAMGPNLRQPFTIVI